MDKIVALKELDFLELLNRQQMLDEKFKEKMGLKDLDMALIEIAYLDEVGEFIHELKPLWCYWKKEKKPIDKQKVLEELSDCLHFYLSYTLVGNSNDMSKAVYFVTYPYKVRVYYASKWKVYRLLAAFGQILDFPLILEFTLVKLGYTLEEFLAVHHQVWLRNMNVRTGDDY